MALKERLNSFLDWWRDNITGDEKGEAQTFVGEMVKAFGHPGALEVGTFEDRVRRKRNGKSTVSFADYVMNGTVLIEMKKRGENLANHYDQLEDYWKGLEKKPKYALLCNFDEIWIYAFPTQFYDPVDRINVPDLPQRTDALEFLIAGSRRKPVFNNNLVEVTKEAAFSLSKVFRSLVARGEDERVAQRYVLQCMLALFAEDIGLLKSGTFTRVIEDCLEDPEDHKSYDLITLLFTSMNRPGLEKAGRFEGVDYFNGGIFSEINPIGLSRIELMDLQRAARENWAKVKPAIFGTIFEESMTKEERHEIGAHFTNEQDIKLIVDPVIVDPWDKQIESATTKEELLQLHEELCNYIVLDPACGSGNFLYIAYIEMKRLENRLLTRLADIAPNTALPERHVAVQQFYGLDTRPFAVELARVTLMIAKKIGVDVIQSDENPLPLDNLDKNILCADALFTDWVEFDAVIGNPPYHGAGDLRKERGLAYMTDVGNAYPDVPGRADYCVYWFRKTHTLMREGSRAGLVGTNTIRQNNSRIGGLDYIVENEGYIFDAVSSMPWSGEAVVHVSIVNWSKGKPPTDKAKLRIYEGKDRDEKRIWRIVERKTINSSLSETIDVKDALTITENKKPKRVFQGIIPGVEGFIIEDKSIARNLIKGNPANQKVILPYIIGEDLVGRPQGTPSRFVIDFKQMKLLEAQSYSEPFKIVKKLVLPVRKQKAEEEAKENALALEENPDVRTSTTYSRYLEKWWQHNATRIKMTKRLNKVKRYIGCSRVTKRNIFEFISSNIRPSDLVQVFAFEDDYTYGILQSSLHWSWFQAKGSSLKSDPRYTPTSVFNTFPFPQDPLSEHVKLVADAAKSLHEFRRKQMEKREDLSLRDMYLLMEEPGDFALKYYHQALDDAVILTYGFDPDSDLLEQLFDLNRSVAQKSEEGVAITAPGIPADYPDPDELVSNGCIQPPELI